ncbi:MAG: hypothetical protein ACRECH_16225 [Nitrososphaerales archaeon]
MKRSYAKKRLQADFALQNVLLVAAIAPAILLLVTYLMPTAVSQNNLQLTSWGKIAVILFPYVVVFTPLNLACYSKLRDLPHGRLHMFIVWILAAYAVLIYQMYGIIKSNNSAIPFVLNYSVFIMGGLILFLLVFASANSKIQSRDQYVINPQ